MIIKLQSEAKKCSFKKKGELYKYLSDKHNIAVITVKKYLNMSEDDIRSLDNPRLNKKRKTATDDYHNMIYKMIADGIDPCIIKQYAISKGYSGTHYALENCIRYFSLNNFGIILNRSSFKQLSYPPGTVIIKRADILKFITCKDDKKKDKTIAKYYKQLIEKYPIIKECEDIYNEFHSILMGTDTDKLDEFIGKHLNKEDSEKTDDNIENIKSGISGFVSSIKKDIVPVKNAISYSDSSGFVEGNNNKFKLVKRILYGRANLVNLFTKSYLAFISGSESFDIRKIMDHKKSRSTGITRSSCNES